MGGYCSASRVSVLITKQTRRSSMTSMLQTIPAVTLTVWPTTSSRRLKVAMGGTIVGTLPTMHGTTSTRSELVVACQFAVRSKVACAVASGCRSLLHLDVNAQLPTELIQSTRMRIACVHTLSFFSPSLCGGYS